MKILTGFISDVITLRPRHCFHSNGMALFIAVLFLSAPTILHADTKTEYKIKAAYLYQFSKFTHWPDQHKSTKDKFLICILGKDPFGPIIKPIETKDINGLPIRLQYFSEFNEQMKTCRILFFARQQNKPDRESLLDLAASHVLTVGDYGDFIHYDGMIGFYIYNNRVHVTFNEPVVEAANLVFDPRLIKLGRPEHKH